MKSILYQLYKGEIDPRARYEPILEEHKDLIHEQKIRYDWIGEALEKMDPKYGKAFNEMSDARYLETEWDIAYMFLDGLRLGMKIMAEVYQTDLVAEDYD
ncbi:MAG: hypothetical protein HFI72_04345 [Peptococcaceae bacterium]|nr:hypothetical protein [Peptococcaceae bacterium]MCI8336368.1 hypothetical protein [Peptococcaceae bacterium]